MKNTILNLLLVIFLCNLGFGPSFASEGIDRPVIYKLGVQNTHTNVLLTSPEINDPDEDDTQHILLDKNIKKIIILAEDFEFEKEEQSFTQFRRHYTIFWILFKAMLIMDLLWTS